jgi:YVTN family beta-propeller protein
MTLSADGSRLFVTGHDGLLTVIDTATNTGKTFLSEPSTADAASPDGKRLYSIHNGFGGTETASWMSARNTDGTFDGATPITGCATDLAVSPDGTRLYVAAAAPNPYRQYRSGSVVIVDTATYTVLDTVTVQVSPDTVTVSADASRLYLTHHDANAISILNLDDGGCSTVGVDDAPIDLIATPDEAQAIRHRSELGHGDRHASHGRGERSGRRPATAHTHQQRFGARIHHRFRQPDVVDP